MGSNKKKNPKEDASISGEKDPLVKWAVDVVSQKKTRNEVEAAQETNGLVTKHPKATVLVESSNVVPIEEWEEEEAPFRSLQDSKELLRRKLGNAQMEEHINTMSNLSLPLSEEDGQEEPKKVTDNGLRLAKSPTISLVQAISDNGINALRAVIEDEVQMFAAQCNTKNVKRIDFDPNSPPKQPMEVLVASELHELNSSTNGNLLKGTAVARDMGPTTLTDGPVRYAKKSDHMGGDSESLDITTAKSKPANLLSESHAMVQAATVAFDRTIPAHEQGTESLAFTAPIGHCSEDSKCVPSTDEIPVQNDSPCNLSTVEVKVNAEGNDVELSSLLTIPEGQLNLVTMELNTQNLPIDQRTLTENM